MFKALASWVSLCLLFALPGNLRAEDPSFASPEERDLYHRRLMRASEVLFNVGYLYAAEGMNHIHDKKDGETTGAILDHGVSLLSLSRQFNQQALEMAKAQELAYEPPQADIGILQGEASEREILEQFEQNFHLSPESFHATLLATVLDPQKDIVAVIIAAMKPVEGSKVEDKIHALLLIGAGENPEEKKEHLATSALASLAAKWGLGGDSVSVPLQGAAPAWDTTREGPSAGGPTVAAGSTFAPHTAAAVLTSAPNSPAGAALPNHGGNTAAVLPNHAGSTGSSSANHAGNVSGASINGQGQSTGGLKKPTSPLPPAPPPSTPATKAAEAVKKAAEAAALAGAKVKDTQISYAAMLNWEMRRALKEFLFAYTVFIHSSAYPCAPVDASGQPRAGINCAAKKANDRYDFATFDPRENVNETNGPYLPSVCQIFSPDNNYCQKAGVPGIPEFAGGGNWGAADPISSIKDVDGLLALKIVDCRGRTEVNQTVMLKLLFGLDTEDGARGTGDPFPGRPGLDHLGYLPRMAFLRSRLDTIDFRLSYDLAAAGFPTVTEKDLATLKAKGAAFDRPRSAFEAARASLKASGFADAQIELSEVPGKTQSTRFVDQVARVTMANTKFTTKGQLDRGDCFSFRESRVIPNFPIGVKAGPDLFESYSVKLSVKLGKDTAKATATAAPNQIRLGPSSSGDADLASAKLYSTENLNSLTSARFPNPLIQDGETDSEKQGFTRNSHLGYLRSAMMSLNRVDIGARLAGALAPWELNRYSPPCTYDSFKYSLPVPLTAADGGATLRRRLNSYLSTSDSPVLQNVVTDRKVALLRTKLLQLHQLDQYSIPDPLLRDNQDLIQFARMTGLPFTVGGDANASSLFERASTAGGACSPGAALLRNP